MPEESFTTPGIVTWTVPDGVHAVNFDIRGAGSGNVNGGRTTGTVGVIPGWVLYLCVGEQGKYHSGRQPGDLTFGSGGYGGHGRGSGNGGDSGGGASWIGMNSATGYIVSLAGGAGGTAGDGAKGGEGGLGIGGPGNFGPGNNGGSSNATGGTQISPGVGGDNGNAGKNFSGGTADNAVLGRGGRGGSVGDGHSHGGGGGGGGWYSGGGGHASGGSRAAGGGGGGSNYTEGANIKGLNLRGGGSAGNGEIHISWVSPPPPHLNPPPPSDLRVNGVELGSDVTTRALTGVRITANVSNPDDREATLLVVRLVAADNDAATEEWNFANYWQTTSNWVYAPGQEWTHAIDVGGLVPNTKYYVRAYTYDSFGQWSDEFAAGSFWTNRPPERPELLTPSENSSFESVDNIFFSWTPIDADDDDAQSAWQVRTRRLTRPNETIRTDWELLAGAENNATSYTIGAVNFTGNQFYIWSARSRDVAGIWSEWSNPKSFFVESSSTPPIPSFPIRDEAVVSEDAIIFKWQFLDPASGVTQKKADLRYRVVGTEEWITHYGDPDPGMPGPMREWLFPLNTFIVGYHYEWQVRTTNSSDITSDWSRSENFWAIPMTGQGLTLPYIAPELETEQPALGCGVNRVYVYDRGGQIMRGEITGISMVRYHRKRDDISNADIIIEDFGKDCGALLSELRTWMHEIVIFRDGKRVWEGPITRLQFKPGQVQIEAKDVMAYLYRRVMRQGYNDTYRVVDGVAHRGTSVVHRAAVIARNALAYDDPNVLQWLTEITHSTDARQMRAVPDYSKMAWEEIDDLAANAGLDYTTAGRRIMFWDTHYAIGRLPEMRDEHFSEPIHVTEYGAQLANFFVVTNNDGVWGAAYRGLNPDDRNTYSSSVDDFYNVYDHRGKTIPPHYGWIEQLVSAFGEQEGEKKVDLTEQAKVELEETLRRQAERGIAARWPAPLVCRVPDNATIQPDVNIGFDQLIPGVWIPIRARGTLREVAQWQKLDTVSVEQTGESAERIMVSMSPAPNAGQDPDADAMGES